MQPRIVKNLQCLEQACLTPIEHMVVREFAAVDSGGGEGADVGRMHPVVDALVDPVVAARHGSFEVDDSGVGPSAGELVERVAPDVGVGYATWNRAVGALGEPHVVDRIAQVTLMDVRLGWLSQNLIDSAARHHVAAKEQLDGLHRRRNLRRPS